jgi:hypothetical protein
MSVDYWSVHLVLPTKHARDLLNQLAPDQWCGGIIGPDEADLHPGWNGVATIDVADLARSYAGALPDEDYWEMATVDLPHALAEVLAKEGANAYVETNRTSALAALDRVLCIPNGVRFLSGHAVAVFSGKSLAEARKELEALFGAYGGTRRAARVLQGYLRGNANGGAALAIIERVLSTLDTAAHRRQAAFFASAVVG